MFTIRNFRWSKVPTYVLFKQLGWSSCIALLTSASRQEDPLWHRIQSRITLTEVVLCFQWALPSWIYFSTKLFIALFPWLWEQRQSEPDMGEIDEWRRINEKNQYRSERNLRFSELRWILKISKMHCSKIEIEIIKNTHAYMIVCEPWTIKSCWDCSKLVKLF